MSTYTPVAPGERIQSLDVLRGFALLGILIMNVQSFSMPTAAYVNPTAWGDLTGINLMVWLASHVLADQKFMTLFSILFGAGVCLFADRAEARSGRSASVHYRRMFWLLVFGLLHVYFLWTGDILVPYAICGCGIYLFRNRSPRRLLVLGICVFSVATFLNLFFAWGLMNYASPEAVAGVASFWTPDAAALEAELAAYQGGWMAQQAYRVRAAFEMHTFVMPVFMLWPCGGAMLVGMALYKWGVLSAARSSRFYRRMIVIGVAAGLTAIGAGVWWNFSGGWTWQSSFFTGVQFNYWGSTGVALGYLGLIMLAVQKGVFSNLQRRLAAVGRLAFTNYILQTVLCTLLFYGHGFGLFGSVERYQQLFVVLAVWLIQLWLSPVWLRRYAYGPLEWAWRALTYWYIPKMRLRESPAQ
ncbi:MAG: DUF418 domain-containing protein [Bacteroidetes bacterium SB0662_bin_6]|nr:DUF418 domain-containing protein [Bacteroidetes bacterium SB0668_bin_1]MYE05066.1 DUF418 domain-containing protein [Bacteroidetes bacterium SB0662_bin_6]